MLEVPEGPQGLAFGLTLLLYARWKMASRSLSTERETRETRDCIPGRDLAILQGYLAHKKQTTPKGFLGALGLVLL